MHKRTNERFVRDPQKYLDIIAGHLPAFPFTIFFGGKAASLHTIAKHIIHLILCIREVSSRDSSSSTLAQVVMVENYNVTAASFYIPVCDISEHLTCF